MIEFHCRLKKYRYNYLLYIISHENKVPKLKREKLFKQDRVSQTRVGEGGGGLWGNPNIDLEKTHFKLIGYP